MSLEHHINNESVEAYFTQMAPSWDMRSEGLDAKHMAVAYLAGVAAGKRVLDVGCGTGIMMYAYLASDAAHVTGVDISQGMISIAREKYAQFAPSQIDTGGEADAAANPDAASDGKVDAAANPDAATGADVATGTDAAAEARGPENARPTVDFACADIIDFANNFAAHGEDARFDCVVIYNAYPHFADVPALVQAVASLLVPGGRFLVAHGMGRATLNACHANVPADITRDLEPARLERRPWEECFVIDTLADRADFYCFGGVLK